MGSHIVRTFRNMLCFKAGLMMAAWAAETCSHTWFNFISAYYWNGCVWTKIYIRFLKIGWGEWGYFVNRYRLGNGNSEQVLKVTTATWPEGFDLISGCHPRNPFTCVMLSLPRVDCTTEVIRIAALLTWPRLVAERQLVKDLTPRSILRYNQHLRHACKWNTTAVLSGNLTVENILTCV